MRIRKNALLLFSKYPNAGLVKTRLSVLKDGMFTPEDAAGLYEAMLLDVVGIGLTAFNKLMRAQTSKRASDDGAPRDFEVFNPGNGSIADAVFDGALNTYALIISTTPASDLPNMEALITANFPEAVKSGTIKFIADEGASFDEHYNDAFEQVWEMGADCILSMGADMPALTVWDVIRGFMALHKLADEEDGGIVIAPDQEMGVSIIGWTRDTDFDHTGVFYNADGLTVLPAYIAKAKHERLPAIYLPPVPDVDTMADLAHNITLVQAIDYCAGYDGNSAPSRTAAKLAELGCDEVRVPPNDLRDPREGIDG